MMEVWWGMMRVRVLGLFWLMNMWNFWRRRGRNKSYQCKKIGSGRSLWMSCMTFGILPVWYRCYWLGEACSAITLIFILQSEFGLWRLSRVSCFVSPANSGTGKQYVVCILQERALLACQQKKGCIILRYVLGLVWEHQPCSLSTIWHDLLRASSGHVVHR